jgi:PAS domain S-box-containing protein
MVDKVGVFSLDLWYRHCSENLAAFMSNETNEPSNAQVARQTSNTDVGASIDYRAIVELADIGITKTETGTGRIYFANDAFCQMIGYSAQELSNGSVSFVEMTHPDDLTRNVSLHQQFLSGQLDKYTIEKRYIRKDGSIFWGRITAKHLPQLENGLKRTLGLIEDISREVEERCRPESKFDVGGLQRSSAIPEERPQTRLKPAEDYIQLNWNKPQRVEMLAKLCGISTRVLFRKFEKIHSCSPAVYVKKVRLQRVRDILLKGERNATVMGVALSGGFSNLGHFARDYRTAFGELPSETLKRGRVVGGGREG